MLEREEKRTRGREEAGKKEETEKGREMKKREGKLEQERQVFLSLLQPCG